MRIFSYLSRSAFLLLAASIVFAPAAARGLGPGGDVYFGYSRSGANNFIANTPAENGWDAAGELHFIPFLGAEVDVAHYGLGASNNDARTTTVLVGPRVTVGLAGIHLFAHGLVGAAHSYSVGGPLSYSKTPLAGDVGGGADFRLLPFFAWRVVGDYITTTDSPSNANHYRFGTGLVFRF